MYTKWFFIKEPVWNNKFSLEKRKLKKLFVTNILGIDSMEEIELWEEIVFEASDYEWNLSSNKWLKNFYRIKWKDKEIILFDNHNHAFYYWLEARKKWLIWDNNTLFHIDEHSDLNRPEIFLLKPESEDLKKVFDYTNYELNVWNYIIPAIIEGIIWDVVQIRNETNLNQYLNTSSSSQSYSKKNENKWIILNLDLDFFRPELDYINYELKKKVILDIADKASIITVATSPFFVTQNHVLKVFKDIFW